MAEACAEAEQDFERERKKVWLVKDERGG